MTAHSTLHRTEGLALSSEPSLFSDKLGSPRGTLLHGVMHDDNDLTHLESDSVFKDCKLLHVTVAAADVSRHH